MPGEVSIDGGGVVADQALPAGTRLRLHPTDDARDDISVWVEGGVVHLAGQYARLDWQYVADNHLAVAPRPLGR